MNGRVSRQAMPCGMRCSCFGSGALGAAYLDVCEILQLMPEGASESAGLNSAHTDALRPHAATV